MVARPSQEYGSPALPLLWRLTGRESTLGGRRSYRPTVDTFTELRQLADDLTELGDNATASLVRQAIDRFSAWKFEAGGGVTCAGAGRTAAIRAAQNSRSMPWLGTSAPVLRRWPSW